MTAAQARQQQVTLKPEPGQLQVQIGQIEPGTFALFLENSDVVGLLKLRPAALLDRELGALFREFIGEGQHHVLGCREPCLLLVLQIFIHQGLQEPLRKLGIGAGGAEDQDGCFQWLGDLNPHGTVLPRFGNVADADEGFTLQAAALEQLDLGAKKCL